MVDFFGGVIKNFRDECYEVLMGIQIGDTFIVKQGFFDLLKAFLHHNGCPCL